MRLLLSGLLAAIALSAAEPPPLEPAVTGVLPRGVQRGREVTVTVRGRNLQNLRAATLSGPGLQVEVVESSAYRAKLKISASMSAELGRHDLRLLAPHGSTLTWFDVSGFPESAESEPNNEVDKAQALSFPALVNGTITAGDYDYFRFQVEANQSLTFDLLATRNGSPLDGVIEILDARGRVLDYSDDYYAFKDPHIVHRFQESGSYYLRVWGSGESGSENSDYRLIAGAMPHADLALPGGARRGATVDLELRGVNLSNSKTVTLGRGLATGRVVSATMDRARVRLQIPTSLEPGELKLHVDGATVPVPFVISDLPEMTIAPGTARRKADPLPVTLGTVINGILDAPRAIDYFTFRVDAPQPVVLSVESMNLGFLLDPLVAVYDESGARIAWQDDPTTNTGKEPANMDPHLVVKLPKAGRYTAAVRDSQFRGDPTFLYRLTLKKAEPDFSLRIVGAHANLYRGRENIVHVRVRRLEGWDQPVDVWAEGLPKGIVAPHVIAEPRNTSYKGTCGETHYLDGTNVEIPIRVPDGAAVDLTKLVFKARGAMHGITVERTARARYWKSRIKVLGDPVEHELFATVTDLPGVVFQTPERAATGAVTVILTRLNNSPEPLRIEGEGVEPVTVQAGVTRADVRLTQPGNVLLFGRVGDRVIGQSHPIRVEAKR